MFNIELAGIAPDQFYDSLNILPSVLVQYAIPIVMVVLSLSVVYLLNRVRKDRAEARQKFSKINRLKNTVYARGKDIMQPAREKAQKEYLSDAIVTALLDAELNSLMSRDEVNLWYARFSNLVGLHDLQSKLQSSLKEKIKERLALYKSETKPKLPDENNIVQFRQPRSPMEEFLLRKQA